MPSLKIRPIRPDDRAAVDALAVRFWGGTRVVDAGLGVLDASGLPGAVAILDGAVAGAVTWRREGDALRIVTIASAREGVGIGRGLLAAAEREARAAGCARIVLPRPTTTCGRSASISAAALC